jgi:hypothetical protein
MAKSPTRSQSPTNGWDVLRFVVNRAFNSGYALPAIGGLIFLASLWIVVQKLDSKDLKELVGEAFADWAAAVGWLLFLAGSAIYLSVVRWMKVRYEAEIARQRELIDRLLPPDKREELKLK